MRRNSENFWFFERDGDFNPTWVLVLVYALVLLAACFCCMYVAVKIKSPWPAIAALSALVSALLAHLISALPRDKAKILASAKVVGEAASAVASVGGAPDTPYDNETMITRGQ